MVLITIPVLYYSSYMYVLRENEEHLICKLDTRETFSNSAKSSGDWRMEKLKSTVDLKI